MANRANDAALLVDDLQEILEDIDEWSTKSADFIQDMQRRLERDNSFEPSKSQLLWLCRLHESFCEDKALAVNIRNQLIGRVKK